MKKILWLDDIRNPNDEKWYKMYLAKYAPSEITWVKSYEEFCDYINKFGVPDVICFDNDLGTGMEGHDCAKYLVKYILDNDIKKDFHFLVQSSNPPARENIIVLLNNLKKFLFRC